MRLWLGKNTVSGFGGTLTLSAKHYGSAVDQAHIQDILAEVAAELDLAGQNSD